MDDIAEQLAHRDNFRRKMNTLKTPEERMRDMAKLQRMAWAILKSSPAGYAHFLKRNFKVRAIDIRDPNAHLP